MKLSKQPKTIATNRLYGSHLVQPIILVSEDDEVGTVYSAAIRYVLDPVGDDFDPELIDTYPSIAITVDQHSDDLELLVQGLVYSLVSMHDNIIPVAVIIHEDGEEETMDITELLDDVDEMFPIDDDSDEELTVATPTHDGPKTIQ